jgi:hypothetical protein
MYAYFLFMQHIGLKKCIKLAHTHMRAADLNNNYTPPNHRDKTHTNAHVHVHTHTDTRNDAINKF